MMQKVQKSRLHSFIHHDNTVGYLFAAPFIIGFLCFTLIPMALSLYYSFCEYKIGNEPLWIGLKNYTDLFADAKFGKSLLVTLQYVIVGVPLKLVFALLVAMLLVEFAARLIIRLLLII